MTATYATCPAGCGEVEVAEIDEPCPTNCCPGEHATVCSQCGEPMEEEA
jgi:hypothetical protein